jgi:hypothetical protein
MKKRIAGDLADHRSSRDMALLSTLINAQQMVRLGSPAATTLTQRQEQSLASSHFAHLQ